ncbi:MAG TPA: aldo/keto reductase [Ramlibacter sp.]|nr:aldo/keto reductase [Ramlibacter sp.]
MKLALGTVQFGLAYGIAGSGAPVAEDEVRRICELAANRGVDCIDTAAGYGDIEQRMAGLAPQAQFSFVSKIPAVPSGGAVAFVRDSVRRSIGRLGSRLRALMFHRQEDLSGAQGAQLWDAASEEVEGKGIALGVSAYEPQALAQIAARFPVRISQLPCNAFDQRIAALDAPGVEVHLRSAFLQGLLLQDAAFAAKRLPAAVPAVRAWRAWCEHHRMEPLPAALSIVKGLDRTGQFTHCVVGVESAAQFEQIADAWDAATPIAGPELAVDDPAIIDPRTWKREEAAA